MVGIVDNGAGKASLMPNEITNEILRSVIVELDTAAKPFEPEPAATPEDRVKALSSAIERNLQSYPAVIAVIGLKSSDFIRILLMDTVSNVLKQPED